MKRHLHTIAAAAMALLTAACSGDSPEATPSKDVLTVGTPDNTVTVAATEAEAHITVRANCAWTAELTSDATQWPGLALATESGDGDGDIRIITGMNTTTITRAGATLTVRSASGIIVRTVALTQQAAPVRLELNGSAADMLAEELPYEFYRELSGGILLLPEEKRSPHGDDLCIMGEYMISVRDPVSSLRTSFISSFVNTLVSIKRENCSASSRQARTSPAL